MVSIPSLMNNFSSFLQNNQVSFTNSLLILCTVAGEQIFKFTAFSCPCSQPAATAYACSFTFGPAAILFIVCLMINNLAWRSWHGCCHRSDNTSPTCCEGFVHFCAVFARVCIVPSAWLFIALLDGNYYVCMRSPEPCTPTKDSEVNKKLFSESQMISWFFLSGLVALASLGICCGRCTDSTTYLKNKYISIYREKEEKYLEENMKVSADALAKANADSFLNNCTVHNKKEWDAISKAPHSGVALNESQIQSQFSPLHKWCLDKNRASQIQADTRVSQQTASV